MPGPDGFAADAPTPKVPPRLRILVVEDDPDTLTVTIDCFGRSGIGPPA